MSHNDHATNAAQNHTLLLFAPPRPRHRHSRLLTPRFLQRQQPQHTAPQQPAPQQPLADAAFSHRPLATQRPAHTPSAQPTSSTPSSPPPPPACPRCNADASAHPETRLGTSITSTCGVACHHTKMNTPLRSYLGTGVYARCPQQQRQVTPTRILPIRQRHHRPQHRMARKHQVVAAPMASHRGEPHCQKCTPFSGRDSWEARRIAPWHGRRQHGAEKKKGAQRKGEGEGEQYSRCYAKASMAWEL